MVVALLVVAFAMIAGGLAAVLQGWDIVLLEHGWTLVVAGSVFASGGAVLLGLAVIVFRLGHLRRELVTIRDRWGRAEFERIAPPPIDPVAAIAAGGLAATGLAAGAEKEPAAAKSEKLEDEREAASPDLQPDLPFFLAERQAEELAAPASPPPVFPPEKDDRVRALAWSDDHEGGTRLKLPDDLLGPAHRADEKRELEERSDAEPPEPADRAVEYEAASAEERAEEEFPPADREPEPADGEREESEAREDEDEYSRGEAPSTPDRVSPVVGTYTSGENRYVMFADGSIEADTPHGIFRFESLDELKSFIASGGEGPAANG